ncbi:MAG TPA: hypothetical protein VMU64_07035 [Acidimicrobiales bacterium]|nr:hypothetical protein [Acidimicrobiales bacterium]
MTTDVFERFHCQYGSHPSITDIGWWRAEVFEAAEAACTRLEEAQTEKRDRTAVAACRSDFERLLEDILEIDRVTNKYLNERNDRWKRMLRQAYGYVPK